MKSKTDTIYGYLTTPLTLFLVVAVLGISGCGKDNGTGSGSDMNMAQRIEENEDLSTFSQLAVDAGLESRLHSQGSSTVFAPTNSAFANLPEGYIDGISGDQLTQLINYHFVSEGMMKSDIRKKTSIPTDQGDSIFVKVGSNIELNHNATLTEGDLEASNGVVHKIDQVILPDAFLNVFEIIHKRYSLTTFACHCTSGRTGLEDVLKRGDMEFTVFAATNAAFENFDQNVDDLSDDELRNILNYHIVEDKILSSELSDGQTLTTRNGEAIMVSVAGDGTITLDNGVAKVLAVDLEGTNGVVYIIDAVLHHE